MSGSGARPKNGAQSSQGHERRGGEGRNGGAADNGRRRGGQKRQKLSSSGRSDSLVTDASKTLDPPLDPPISMEAFKALSTDEKLISMFKVLYEVRTMSTKVDTIESNLNTVAKETTQNTSRIKSLEYHSIDSEARGRRLNLIFRGIPEIYLDENCTQLVRNFLKDSLQLTSADAIPIQRAHRLGAPARGTQARQKKSRPIIVCFMKDSDVQLILANAHKLRGKPELGVNRDYPQEIVQARSKLWPSFKEMKGKYPKKVHIGYPAKLIVNGKVVQDEFPDWHSVLKKSRCHRQLAPTDDDNETFVSKNPFSILCNESDTNDDTDMAVSSDSEEDAEAQTTDHYSQTMFDQENPQRRRVSLLMAPLEVSDTGPSQGTQTNANATGDLSGADRPQSDSDRVT